MEIDNEVLARLMAQYPHVMTVHAEEIPDYGTVYLARNPMIRGCMAQGDTKDEAVRELEEAKFVYFLSMIEDGLDISDYLPVKRAYV